MQDLGFRFAHTHFILSFPDGLAESVKMLFRDIHPTEPTRDEKAIEIVREGKSESYRFISESGESESIEGAKRVVEQLPFFIRAEIARSLDSGLLFYGAALAYNKKIILLPGQWSAGRSILLTTLLSQGWRFLTDLCAYKAENSSRWYYLKLPPAIESEPSYQITTQLGRGIESYLRGQRFHRLILESTLLEDTAVAPSMCIFADYRDGSKLTLAPLSSEQTVEGLTKCLPRQTEEYCTQVSEIAQQIRAIKLSFGSGTDLEKLSMALSYIVEAQPTESELIALLTAFQPKSKYSVSQLEVKNTTPANLQEATPAGTKKLMTIGMATYDDYDGVYFTVQSIRMYHPEITDKTEILVIDNQPDGPAAQELKNLDKIVANYRYFPFGSHNSTAVRDLVFRQANADFVLCLDSHVMLMPGTLKRLIDYFEANPDCNDLLQGPMFAENLQSLHTHFEPVWTKGMYGFWGRDERAEPADGPPFEIPMQGLGLFACRKEAWVGFNPRFRGFGGEEGYLHEKFRQRGGRALCLPFLRWLHRFARPGGVPYPINWHDRIFNYMVGIDELGLDPSPMQDHFKEHLGEESGTEILKRVDQEIRSPFFCFDAIYCISPDSEDNGQQEMTRRLRAMGIEASVRHFRTVDSGDSAHVNSAMTHRAILQEAMLQDLDNLLVLEKDALFLDETLAYLSRSIHELKQREWNLFFLGGQLKKTPHPCATGCRFIGIPTELRSTLAVAYGKSVFEKIVNDLPDSHEKMITWLRDHQGYNSYLMQLDRKFIATPPVTMTAQLLENEDENYRSRFTLGKETD